PVAHSADGGATWSIAYADKVVLQTFDPNKPPDCSFHLYIGAMPFIAADGTVYDAALKFGVDDPTCIGAPLTEEEWIFASHDGGQTFPQKVKIADVSPSTGSFFGSFQLGPGQFMRNLELPTLASRDDTLYAAWNDGASGHSHVVLAASKDGGNTWKTSQVTSGDNDQAQPALSADAGGLHLLYYEISPVGDGTSQLDVLVSNSKNGSKWSSNRVTSQSFPGVYTLPQFDPIIAFTYMGDYIANVSDGSHQYFAWGDNRDVVTNWLWPQGRHDPDVFFARQ
ncbi:MAG TPA: sialidase family protein, partial [Acidimicrobiales bacterium]